MTTPTNFEGSNHHFGPPPGVSEDECGWLYVFSNGRCNVSAWKPSAEMLEALNRGEPIFISQQSGMNPNNPNTPLIFPVFVGSEAECREVVARTGETW